MDEDKAIRAAKLTLGAVMDKRRAKTAESRAGGQIAPSKYLPNVPRQVHADGGPVDPAAPAPVDLGQVREQRQLQTFHKGLMGDVDNAVSDRMEAHQKALDAGHFDGFEVGDTFKGKAAPFKITGRFVRPWTRGMQSSFDRFGVQPSLVEHEGKQYVPMVRTLTGVKDSDDWQEGEAYVDLIRAAGYPKMGGLRAVKADGGSVADRSPMFEGMHEDLYDEDGKPMDLWHGTPVEGGFDAFDNAKLGKRDAGFYGRGHYLTPTKGNAEGYADPDEVGTGTVMGPLHAALKNPYVWDASDKGSHRTLRDLQSMGIMREKSELEPWDNLQRHHIDPFMREMQKRGHDGVLMKTNRGLSEIVVFNPNMIKHRDAEVGDPNDPRIMRATGGKVDLYSKAAKIVRGLKDNPMPVEDIIKYALGKGAKKAEIDYTDLPRGGKARPSQVADHIEGMQPQIAVIKREQNYRYGSDNSYLSAIRNAEREGNHALAEELNREWEAFAGIGPSSQPQYAKYQLPDGQNYREHILTLENHQGPTYTANIHWGRTPNPLAHIRMSDRTDTSGRKILHIEELQSDWNNDARRKGFSTGTEKEAYQKYVEQMRVDAINNIDPTASPMIRTALRDKYHTMDPYTLALKLGRQDEHREMAEAARGARGVPKAPYINPDRDDWAEMAMKHVLTEAAKGGYDGIAFTPDEAQEERWPGHTFKNMYNSKFPNLAQKLVRQHDPETDDDMMHLSGWAVPMIPLSDKARDSINQNGFSSFRRGGYVTHVRRAR